MLPLNAAAHFLVDGVCAAALYKSAAADMAAVLLLYNTLAFSTQCLVGLWTDRHGHCGYLVSAACAIVALGFFLPLPVLAKAAVLGLGNSVFHVAGGSMTLLDAKGRAAPLGIFVAPGSLGLILGCLYPELGLWLAALLLLLAAMTAFAAIRPRERPDTAAAEPVGGHGEIPVALLLLLAVAARAIGGSAVSFPWRQGLILPLVTGAAVCAGKAAGGFLCDRLGASATALISIPAAALLTAFFGGSMPLSLLGQFMLNLTMPVTLLLIYRALPDSPGFAFGLAASVLWPATAAGRLMAGAGDRSALWVIVCFMFGLAAILLAAEKERRKI